MAQHLPEQPNLPLPVDSWYWKGWFKDVWNWIKRTSDIEAIQLTNFTLTDRCVYPVDTTAGAVAATFPPALGLRGRMFAIKKIAGANNVTATAAGGDNIDGAGTFVIGTIGQANWFVSDGNSTWYIL